MVMSCARARTPLPPTPLAGALVLAPVELLGAWADDVREAHDGAPAWAAAAAARPRGAALDGRGAAQGKVVDAVLAALEAVGFDVSLRGPAQWRWVTAPAPGPLTWSVEPAHPDDHPVEGASLSCRLEQAGRVVATAELCLGLEPAPVEDRHPDDPRPTRGPRPTPSAAPSFADAA